MDIEATILARLVDDAGVAALVGDRVAWVERIQGEDYPGITLQIIDEDRRQLLRGFDSLQPLLVQLDIWALTHASGKAIKDTVIAALVPEVTTDDFKFNRAFVRARDLSERAGERTIFRPSLDFTFNYSLA